MNYLIENHIKPLILKGIDIYKIYNPNYTKVKILDIGCGNKPYKSLFEKNFENLMYIGVDYYNKNANLILNLNKERLLFKNNSFDIIFCTEVLEHLYNPFNVLNEMKRLLKPNGILIITSPFMFYLHEKKNDYFRFTENFYKRYFNKDFKILKIKKSNKFLSFPLLIYTLTLGHYLPIFHWINHPLIKLLDKLSDLLLKNRIINNSFYIDIGVIIIKK